VDRIGAHMVYQGLRQKIFNDRKSDELAVSIARFYHAKKGHMVCVRIYYGN
jgi:hypothetical protein